MSAVRLAEGHVFHARPGPSKNSFRYPIFYLNFLVSEEALMKSELAQNYRGLLSIRRRDFLAENGEDLDREVREFLRRHCDFTPSRVRLQTIPRMFGYAFNPINFWFCENLACQMEAVLCEVHNTFGEKHFYWLKPPSGLIGEGWLTAEKVFHVSPFFPVEGSYRFRFRIDDHQFHIDIHYMGPDGQVRLTTGTSGVYRSLDAVGSWRLLLRYGWLTPLVVLRIHYQAFKLWIKKATFYPKPEPPKKEVTT